jgi:hypothetical protein
MQKRLPLRIEGKDVHIVPVTAEDASASAIWDDIVQRIGEGLWHAVRPTEQLEDKDKNKLFNALKNRAWYAGYSSEHLALRVTQAEGICFRWLNGNPPDPEEIANVRKERLDHRRKKQKETRARKKRKELENGSHN